MLQNKNHFLYHYLTINYVGGKLYYQKSRYNDHRKEISRLKGDKGYIGCSWETFLKQIDKSSFTLEEYFQQI